MRIAWGAVAAPTAGLHFDQPMLEQLSTDGGGAGAGDSGSVGAGTFRPMRVDRLEDHVMHSEYVEVGRETCDKVRETRLNGGRVVAVGTPVCAALRRHQQGGD